MHGTWTRPPIGIASQPEVVLHADLGGHLDLRHRAAADFRERPGRHRAGDAHLALAANLRAGDRGIELVKNANRRGRKQKPHDAIFTRARHESPVVMEHRRDNAGRAVCRRSDHAAARSIFLAGGERKEVNPVHRDKWIVF